MELNWAGSHAYTAREIVRPDSMDELQSVVAHQPRVRALGARHSFTAIADTDGVLVSLDHLPLALEVDETRGEVSVSGGATFHAVGEELHRRGWALAAQASLPHISVAGAIATGTHGSGTQIGSLASMVSALEVVDAAGDVRRIARGEEDFAGWVVGLGALGVVSRVTLDVVPAFDMWQQVWLDLPWSTVLADFDAVLGSAYSVSVFTDWTGDAVPQVWVKGLVGAEPPDLSPARAAQETVHMIPGMPGEPVTAQLGVVGPSHERLPHFRAAFTPSSGSELQSEYLLPLSRAAEALDALRSRAELFAPLLQISEIRTVAADDLWLSGAHDTDVVALHFTWHLDWAGVHTVLPELERLLLPLGARPHWGKCFTPDRDQVSAAYPMLERFAALRDRVDPARKFGNSFLDQVL